jgi:integrase
VAAVEGVIKNRSPIVEIFKFNSLTGPRLGEVLHMEWEDFDEKNWDLDRQIKTSVPYLLRAGMETEMG